MDRDAEWIQARGELCNQIYAFLNEHLVQTNEMRLYITGGIVKYCLFGGYEIMNDPPPSICIQISHSREGHVYCQIYPSGEFTAYSNSSVGAWDWLYQRIQTAWMEYPKWWPYLKQDLDAPLPAP